ncbi:MAG: hypothetical protein PHG16_06130 [Lachnospiraceae bacterium]|nr:hypothetical protein [Lachnospiraceae bacterium]
MEYIISKKDREILRETAKKQLEYANTEKNRRREAQWYLHNDLKGERPMVQLEMWSFNHEILPDRIQCEGRFAADLEWKLYSNYLNQELLDDDCVTPDYFGLNYDTWFRLFDIEIKEEFAKNANGSESLGRHFKEVIEDLEEDYDKLKSTRFGVNLEESEKKRTVIEDAIGDILPVRMKMDCLYSVPMQMIVHFMSMENMMFALYDYPDLFSEMMNRIADDTLAYYRMLEKKGLILPTTSFESVGNGTWAFTHDLPGMEEWKKRAFTTKDVWGFMDAQETVGISPDMYQEFIFPCYQKISSQFGLLSYGCCEPVNPVWDTCLSRLKNLRKISISPWCDEEYMGKQLAGSNVIYHRKPSPNYLGVGTTLDEEALRKHIRQTCECARGCKLEITQRDVYTIHHDIAKARRYVEIIQEEIENHWR